MHASGVRASIRSISVAFGKSIAASEMMTSDLEAPPRASGPYDWLWTAVLLVEDGRRLGEDDPGQDQPLPAGAGKPDLVSSAHRPYALPSFCFFSRATIP